MASTISMVDARSIAVVIRSASTTSHTPSFPPFPSKKFVCSPAEHGLPRTGLDVVSDQSRFLAVMDALSYQLHKISLSELSADHAAALRGSSVQTETPTRTKSITVNDSVRRKFTSCRSKIFSKCTQSIRASFRRMALGSGEKTKKARGASRPLSQYSPQASPPLLYFGVPPSDSLPAVSTTEDGNGPAGTPMDGVQQSSSPQPTSPGPMPMELEAGTPSSNATLVPNSRRAPCEPSINCELHPSVPDPTDTVMHDGEDVSSRETERVQSVTETFINFVYPQRGSTSLDKDTEMKNPEESKSFTPLRPMSIPSVQPMEATSASNELGGTSEIYTSRGPAPTSAPTTAVEISHQEGPPAQTSFPTPRLDTAPQSERPTEVARPQETGATQREVGPIHSPGSVSTSTGTTTSIDPLTVAPPSPTAASSTTGSTTPTLSTRSDLTPERGQPTQTHAARLHQVLGKWGLSKEASRSSQPAVSDAEEAEAEAFFANLKKKASVQPPVKAKPNPAPLASPSEPMPTRGSAARTLMDELMAGFGRITKPKPSQQQAPVAAHPSTKPVPATRNPPRSSLVMHGPSPAVAGRPSGPRTALPHYIGNGSGVSASSGSMIPTSRAPSAVPMPSKGGGPSGRIPPAHPSEAIPRTTTSGPSTSAPGDGQPGQERAIKGTRRVAKAVVKTGLTWQIVQQRVREAQAASDLDQVNAAAPTPTGLVPSLGRSSTQPSERSEEEPTGKRRCL